MATRSYLGEFELMVMLALIRLGEDAYGVPISREIEIQTGREVILGSVYATLERLEEKGLVSSYLGDPTPERGRTGPPIFSRHQERLTKSSRDAASVKQPLARLAQTERTTSMNRSEPPAVASWLLQHVTRKTSNEALAGDLAEEFTHGRSAAWYWRQVLLAILVMVLEKLRSALFVLGFACLWSIGVTSFWGRYFLPSQIQSLLQRAPWWYAHFQWPWSTVVEVCLFAALNTTYLAAGVATYLLLSKRVCVSGLFGGTAIGFILQIVRMVALPVLRPGRSLTFMMLSAIMLLSMSVARGTDEARETSVVE